MLSKQFVCSMFNLKYFIISSDEKESTCYIAKFLEFEKMTVSITESHETTVSSSSEQSIDTENKIIIDIFDDKEKIWTNQFYYTYDKRWCQQTSIYNYTLPKYYVIAFDCTKAFPCYFTKYPEIICLMFPMYNTVITNHQNDYFEFYFKQSEYYLRIILKTDKKIRYVNIKCYDSGNTSSNKSNWGIEFYQEGDFEDWGVEYISCGDETYTSESCAEHPVVVHMNIPYDYKFFSRKLDKDILAGKNIPCCFIEDNEKTYAPQYLTMTYFGPILGNLLD